MKLLTSLFFSLLFISSFGQVNYTYFSKVEIEQDLDFAFEKLMSIHPLLLDENKLSDCQVKISRVKDFVKDSMTQNEIYMLIAPVFASLNDGHTGVVVPTDQRVEFSKAGGKSFPFLVDIVNDSICVSFYCGNDTFLFQNGEQILEINGIKSSKIIRDMESLVSGESAAIRHKVIADKFRFLIWILYGFEGDYELLVKDNRDKILKMTVPGVSGKEFIQNRKRMPETKFDFYTLDFKPEIKTAVMKIKTFADLKGFCAFADSAFAKIKSYKVENLIIDVRDNGGGRSVVVDSLMNYLTKKEYFQYKKVEVRISTALKEYYGEKHPEYLEWINLYKPDDLVVMKKEKSCPIDCDLRFDGNLFLLTNSKTYSAASTFVGIFKNLKLGEIIGEETGGKLSYYGDFWFLSTPNSNIEFYVSPKRFVQYGGEEYDRGVIPDYIVKDKGDSLIDYVFKQISSIRN